MTFKSRPQNLLVLQSGLRWYWLFHVCNSQMIENLHHIGFFSAMSCLIHFWHINIIFMWTIYISFTFVILLSFLWRFNRFLSCITSYNLGEIFNESCKVFNLLHNSYRFLCVCIYIYTFYRFCHLRCPFPHVWWLFVLSVKKGHISKWFSLKYLCLIITLFTIILKKNIRIQINWIIEIFLCIQILQNILFKTKKVKTS